MNNRNSFDKPAVLPLSETQLKEFKENMVAKKPRKVERHRYRCSATVTVVLILGKTRNRASNLT